MIGKDVCQWLADQYHPADMRVAQAIEEYSPEQFLRLFVTAHGMKPAGIWQTHTYMRYTDSSNQQDHFFLAPAQSQKGKKQPFIRFEENLLKIDDLQTAIFPQSIPHTTPFWYFHYDPNLEDRPYHSMTLNLSPSCLERCVLCAGAKTGRVNNGMEDTLSAQSIVEQIFKQHPQAQEQLDSVAIVTGCFKSFSELKSHLTNVRTAIDKLCSPSTYRVLEHNVTEEEQFSAIVGELGYDVFVTLECFDQEIRNIALNGKVGRKGRNSQEFIKMIETYAQYLESHPELNKKLVHVTYLMGLDSLEVTEYFFQKLADINSRLQRTSIVPWLSIFTPYNDAMRLIQRQEFSLGFLFDAIKLCKKYFSIEMLNNNSGSTREGYARGLF
ncbi:MAG: hypothetical protein ACK4PR_06275 [Gammaproteobacteria bacterium]